MNRDRLLRQSAGGLKAGLFTEVPVFNSLGELSTGCFSDLPSWFYVEVPFPSFSSSPSYFAGPFEFRHIWT